jgi:pimeloyl-ACP methyl ester carboxylesterase
VSERDERDAVLVLHGLWMNRFAMLPLMRALRNAGFAPLAPDYHSMRGTLADNVEHVARGLAVLPARRVHLVGHSLGGLLALALLQRERPDPRLGRAVLLGSPVAGCESARRFSGHSAGRWLLGQTAGLWTRLPMPAVPPAHEVGMIAGSGRLGLAQFVVGMSGEHDGVVRVEETRLQGLRDHLVLPVSHSGMLLSRPVARQCVDFLRHGRFRR